MDGLFGYCLDSRFGERGGGCDDEFGIFFRKDFARKLRDIKMKEVYVEGLESRGIEILGREGYSIPSGIYDFFDGSVLLKSIQLQPGDGRWVGMDYLDFESLKEPDREIYRRLAPEHLKPFVEDFVIYNSHNLSVIDHLPMFKLFDAWYSGLDVFVD